MVSKRIPSDNLWAGRSTAGVERLASAGEGEPQGDRNEGHEDEVADAARAIVVVSRRQLGRMLWLVAGVDQAAGGPVSDKVAGVVAGDVERQAAGFAEVDEHVTIEDGSINIDTYDLEDVDLEDVDLEDVDLEDVDLEDVDLEDVDVDVDLDDYSQRPSAHTT